METLISPQAHSFVCVFCSFEMSNPLPSGDGDLACATNTQPISDRGEQKASVLEKQLLLLRKEILELKWVF